MNFLRTVVCPQETDSLALGHELGRRAYSGLVICLEGTLGAGKTVFARGFARGLGIAEPVTSPTYPIIQEYGGEIIFYHMDFYRLADEVEVLETGAQELLEGGGVCLVEWPQRAVNLFDAEALRISIAIQADQSREFTLATDSEATWRNLRIADIGGEQPGRKLRE